jgi:hypothetical protein
MIADNHQVPIKKGKQTQRLSLSIEMAGKGRIFSSQDSEARLNSVR